MPRYVIAPAAVVAAPIRGSSDLFPVRRVYCIGRNYAAHAVEMGHDPDREPPFFFQKNADNLDFTGEFPYPPETRDVHHEVELVVALRAGGANLPVERALDCVFGYAVGLDMTRRDLQAAAKAAGRPWEVGKAFERSAPMGPIVPAGEIGHPARGAADRRPRPDDLEGSRDRRRPLDLLHARARRRRHDRHARGRRAGREGRRDRGGGRGRGRARRARGLTTGGRGRARAGAPPERPAGSSAAPAGPLPPTPPGAALCARATGDPP
jgi:hypothetical protein